MRNSGPEEECIQREPHCKREGGEGEAEGRGPPALRGSSLATGLEGLEGRRRALPAFTSAW